MVSVTHQTIATGDALAQVTRPARALIGWMHEVQEQTLMEHGPDLADYAGRFMAQPDCRQYVAEGWSVKIADLSKVVALQPMVFWDHAQERTLGAASGDMAALAEITLPIRTRPERPPVQFDENRKTWMVTSRNPNLRIVGQFTVPVDSGGGQEMTGCGFAITVTASFVQVARYRNRLLLRDGYHRSLGLLSRGVTHVPVLYREFGAYEPLGLGPGMLPEGSYLGERPPFLADYFLDSVAAEVSLPASQKMIVIQGIEMTPMG